VKKDRLIYFWIRLFNQILLLFVFFYQVLKWKILL
jgi:hypothetical protein